MNCYTSKSHLCIYLFLPQSLVVRTESYNFNDEILVLLLFLYRLFFVYLATNRNKKVLCLKNISSSTISKTINTHGVRAILNQKESNFTYFVLRPIDWQKTPRTGFHLQDISNWNISNERILKVF